MSIRPKNVARSTKTTGAKKVPRKTLASKAAAVSQARHSPRTFSHNRASGRAHRQGEKPGFLNTQIARFNPCGTNQVLPREYYTKVRAVYNGTLPAANFSATGAYTTTSLVANDPVEPFANVGLTFSWMGTAPTANAITNAKVLFTARLYNSLTVLGTKWEFVFTPPNSVTNNAMEVTLTPAINGGAGPLDVTSALKQPFTAHRVFQTAPANDADASCSLYVDWARFIGEDSEFYNNEPDYSAQVSPTGVYSSPITLFPIVFNANMMDLVPPNGPIPFVMTTTMYLKFFDFVDAQITP